MPLSSTRSCGPLAAATQRTRTTRTGLAGSLYFTAFANRFISTSSTRPASAVSGGRSSAMSNVTPRTSAMSASCPATSRLTAPRSTDWSFGAFSERRVSRGQPLEFPRHVPETHDIALERLDEAAAIRVVGRLEQARQHLEYAERLADLVAHEASETAELAVLPFDGLGVAGDERIHRAALQLPHRLLRARHRQHGRGGVGLLAELRGFAGEEAFEDFAEELVLTEELVHRGALVEAQQPEFGRLGHHRGIGGDLLISRRAQVVGNLAQQLGYVIEQLMCREDVAAIDVEQHVETLEPGPGKRGVLRREAIREVIDRGVEVARQHRRGVLRGRRMIPTHEASRADSDYAGAGAGHARG